MYSFKIYENIYLNVSYAFSKFDESKKIKVSDIPSDTTHGWACP
jgi:hypothetical protein